MKHRFNEIIKEELDKENDCKNLVCTERFKNLAKLLLDKFCSKYFPEFNDLEFVAMTIKNNKISVIGINWINDEISYEISEEKVEIKTESNNFYLKITPNNESFTAGDCDFEFNFVYNGDIVSIKNIHKKNMIFSVYTDIDEDDDLSIIEKHNTYSDLIPDYEVVFNSSVINDITFYNTSGVHSNEDFTVYNDQYINFPYFRRLGMRISDKCHEERNVLDFRTYKK